MGMHSSFIIIQGNQLETLPEVFPYFKYFPTGAPQRIIGWKTVLDKTRFPAKGKPNTIVYKAACYLNNWTIVYDPEMLMADNETACSNISNLLGTRVFGMICESTSNTYAYINCIGNLTRSFWIGDGEIFKDSGEKFPEEPTKRTIDEMDLVETMRRLGVNLQELEKVEDFFLFEFDESNMGASDTQNQVPVAVAQTKKPWWRFW